MKTKDWFTDWFNTPYYHILYKDRNDNEAQQFIKKITEFLSLPKNATLLDLPCGKGRHSVFLNSLGFKVIGADLSENSIQHAKNFENENLKFIVQDMREPLHKKYDAVFNLFTSFGYFKEDKEDILVLQNIKNCLKEDGFFVFDFLNADFVKSTLVSEEIKIVENIEFHLKREIIDGFILKYISFISDEETHFFTEKVKYLDVKKIKSFFEKVGLKIVHIFGDYQLHPFDEKHSKRLLLVAK